MLNLLVMMRSGFSLLIILCSILTSLWPQTQGGETPDITSPQAGQALQGAVLVAGKTDLKGFQSADVSYSYTRGNGSWFLIGQSREAVEDGKLAVWDTTTITDGDYLLRVQVFMDNGSVVEKIIQVRVRNYSPIETETPQPTVGSMEAKATTTPTSTPYRQPTPTHLPENPAIVTVESLAASLRCGIILAILAFLGLGVYVFYKRRTQLK